MRDYYDLPSDPAWLNQTHSSICCNATGLNSIKEADASFTTDPGIVCAILTADCLPVFVSKKDGSMVGIAHAGWRGLSSGVLENLIDEFDCMSEDIVVHLGPAISRHSFEVGKEVKDIFSRNTSILIEKTGDAKNFVWELFGDEDQQTSAAQE